MILPHRIPIPTDFQNLAEVFAENFWTYPGIVANLSETLGVSANALTRLGVGFVPVVTFKKGPNTQGWFCTPERDAAGKPIGLTLRNGDKKPMYPGSDHGPIYDPNDFGDSVITGTWVRTAEAGVLCPVCGKPDGCLVNSLSPSDPDGDATCIRIREGSIKETKLGWLHRRSPRPTPGSERSNEPIIVVEGMSDTAIALDLGCVGVGRPSNLAGLDVLCDLLRNRGPIIIVGENDLKPNGQWPGRTGALAAFQALRKVCKDVTYLMPPHQHKDLRAWKNTDALDLAGFLEYHEAHKENDADETILEDSRPLTMARMFIKDKYALGNRSALKRWAATWYQYDGAKYAPVEQEAFRSPMYIWAHDKLVANETAKGQVIKPLVANLTLIANMEAALTADTLVSNPKIPCWINGIDGPNPKNLIVFQNGILDVTTSEIQNPTPDLFSTVALPFPYDPVATCPEWDSFLSSSLGDDLAKIDLLQEWFGYCLTPDTSMQKLMYFRGPPGSGKGTIQDVLGQLVGVGQYAATSFSDMAEDFGLHNLLGKLVAIIGDCQMPKFKERRGLELLLNIAGEDAVRINKKFKDAIEGHKLFARICMASNVMIEIPDHAGAMVRRMNMIVFNRSFQDNPDTTLREKLGHELPGIANWALTGLRRLREQGAFTVPESSREGLEEYRINSSPVLCFLQECTTPDPEGEVDARMLFDAWTKWAEERKMGTFASARFNEQVKMSAPYVTLDVGYTNHKYRMFRGVRFQPWVQRKFLGGN